MEDVKDINGICYKEIMVILSCLSESDLNKIPQEKIEYYFENMDRNYEYELDPSKSFVEQDMHYGTELLLANLYIDYLSTPNEKEIFNRKKAAYLEKVENEKREKYNPDNIFKNNNIKKEIVEENINIDNQQLVEYKENIIKKIINKIKNILKINLCL